MDLMEDLDPEEARSIVDPALKLMIDAVHRYNGSVVQSTRLKADAGGLRCARRKTVDAFGGQAFSVGPVADQRETEFHVVVRQLDAADRRIRSRLGDLILGQVFPSAHAG
jgi:hypothetical protein